MKLKVLIVDDTILYRKIIQDILAELPDVVSPKVSLTMWSE